MKTQISALMDGELEDHELAAAFDALRRDEDLRRQWGDGQMIAAALRDEPNLAFDVTSRVMAALEPEPTVLAPHPSPRRDPARPALALAATLAGVAVVGWLALGPDAELAPSPVEQVAPRVVAQAGPAAQPAPQVVATPRLQEYLVAHQAHGAPVGGTRNIRTVAAGGR